MRRVPQDVALALAAHEGGGGVVIGSSGMAQGGSVVARGEHQLHVANPEVLRATLPFGGFTIAGGITVWPLDLASGVPRARAGVATDAPRLD